MKKLYLLMPLVMLMVSCMKDNLTPPPTVNNKAVDHFNQSTYNSVFSLIKENRNPNGVKKRTSEIINLEVNEAMLYLEAALGAYLTDPELIPTNSIISEGFAAIPYSTNNNGEKMLDQNAMDSLATAIYNNCVSLGTQALSGQSGVKFLSMLDLNWTIDTTVGIVQVRPSYVFSSYVDFNYSNMQTNVGYSPFYNSGCGVANLNQPGGALQLINSFLNSYNNPHYKPLSKNMRLSLGSGQRIAYWGQFHLNLGPQREVDINTLLANLNDIGKKFYRGSMPALWIGYKNECWESTTIDFYKNSIANFIQNEFSNGWDESKYEIGYFNISTQDLTGFFLIKDANNNLIPYINTTAYSPLNPLFPSNVEATWLLYYSFGIPYISDNGVPIRF